jgi:peptidoglycan/xylan/chitin deacetylase (PgdA/CDA1 family)
VPAASATSPGPPSQFVTIDLFSRDARSAFGIAAILDAEKIPFRRIATLEEAGAGALIVATRDLTAAEITKIEHRPALVLHGGDLFARRVLGAEEVHLRETPSRIALGERIWPPAVTELAAAFGKTTLRIPRAPVCGVGRLALGKLLADLTIAERDTACATQAAVVENGRCVWSAIDLGSAFAELLSEGAPAHLGSNDTSALRSWVHGLGEAAYYAAPAALRRWVQKRSYAMLARRLEAATDASEYPIDPSGWLMIELLRSLLRRVTGTLVRVERWPAPYRAAAALTHDIEPRCFAYTRGLDRLLDSLDASGHPATLGLVAGPSARYLTDARAGRIASHQVICHGLEHRGENVHGRYSVAADLDAARAELESRMRRRVAGYRSPRLDRSPDLVWALDHAGFAFDSSYPDVDRENLAHFGAGVRLNLPYRPPVTDQAGAIRPSRCLELPLTAPDCIQPLFAGESVDQLRLAVTTKAEFVRASGGLYVALVHGGVFGDDDAALRMAHLAFVAGRLRHPDVWLADLEDIAAWWRGREALSLSLDADDVRVTNNGPSSIAGVRVVIERDGAEHVLAVPPLAAGAEVVVAVDGTAAQPAA